MRVLVTGGTGMVGRNILESQSLRGLEVLAPARAELDLARFDAVLEHVRRTKPDVVVHAAGKVGGIQANLADPVGFFLENLEMGRNVVWAAYKSGVQRLINLSSSCVYPREAQNPLREESVLTGPLEPSNEGYALAKIATMRLCHYIGKKDPTFRYKSLVPCNLYGLHDHFDASRSHLVAAVLHKIHEAKERDGDSVEIWGDGTARREFLYAGDLADCVARAVRQYDSLPEVMNVGTGRDLTVDEYYQLAAAIVGYRGRFVHDPSEPVGMPRKVVDVSKATAWGWRARTPLRDGLSKTYAYYIEGLQAAERAT